MKKKSILLAFLSVCLYSGLFAQKRFQPGKDTLTYFMDYDGEPVNGKAIAAYLLIIFIDNSPDR